MSRAELLLEPVALGCPCVFGFCALLIVGEPAISPNNLSVSYPEFAPLFSNALLFANLTLSPPPAALPFSNFSNFCTPFIANAAPATLPINPAVVVLSNPNIFLRNFSAGNINPNTISEYITLFPAKSYAELTKTMYINKWNGCITKLNIYSFNHKSNACDLPSPILSIGYDTATNGAIIVKNIVHNSLFAYIKQKYAV